MIRLRPAEEEDRPFFWHLRREIEPDLTRAEHAAWWVREQEHEDRFVAMDGPVMVGVIRLTATIGDPAIAVISIQVAEHEQGRGAGTQMLTAIRPIAKELGYERLTARVALDNRASQRAFLGAGYAPTGFAVTL